MTNNVARLTQLVERIAGFHKGKTCAEVTNTPDTTYESLEVGDKVKLISNGNLFEVVGLVENGFIQCKPINKDLIDKFFDNYTSFKRSQLEKVEE